MPNKRRSERVSCAVPVDSKKGGLFDQVQTIDFSRGGLGFVSHQRIPINKRVAIELDLFDELEPVVVVGRVRWVRTNGDSETYRIGLAFEDILSGAKSRIAEYFKK